MGSFKYLMLLLFTAFGFYASGQDDPILLTNPSFEGTPTIGKAGSKLPDGWFDCGFPSETPPDVHLVVDNPFGVEQTPFEGNSYLGLVVRKNDTWERVSQRLTAPLKAGQCYEFTISLSRSLFYLSKNKPSGEEANFTTPAVLRIWGGNGYCNRAELLAESSSVINSRWLKYNFKFNPTKTHTYIVFEAFYKTPTPFPYNGNILMDDASPIMPVPCEVVTPEAPPLSGPVDGRDTPRPPSPAPPSPAPPSPKPSGPKILADLDRSKIKEGQTIRIDKLYFIADSTGITKESYPVLDEVYEFLATNKDVVVELGGHTNNIPEHYYCDRLSTQRAKAVADYLIKKGISKDRLHYKGYGKRKPLVSNSTAYGRKKNQRVEIKILSFNG
ncbi:MAG TPA: OmpA family protein [Bacteroidetes bacterium]|nr:OmpA family protein [Bacteroidota bacterium]